MYMPRKRMIAGSTLLLAAVLAGCSDQAITSSPAVRAPDARSSIITPTQVTTVWDFAAIFGAGDPATDLGSSHAFTDPPTVGTITASANTGFHVTVKNQGDPEIGLGLCNNSIVPCDNDEIGHATSDAATLSLTFTGFPAGTTVTALSFGSVQLGEGVAYAISNNGGSTFGPIVTVIPGTVGADLSITLPTPQSTTGLVIRFSAASGGVNDNDYTVHTVTTSTPAASTLFCTPGFWKNKGLGLWTNGQGLFYNDFSGSYPSAPQTFLGVDFGKKNGSNNPTLLDVVSQPNIYGGDAANNVAALIGSFLFGSPININQNPENCPSTLTIIGNFPPPV